MYSPRMWVEGRLALKASETVRHRIAIAPRTILIAETSWGSKSSITSDVAFRSDPAHNSGIFWTNRGGPCMKMVSALVLLTVTLLFESCNPARRKAIQAEVESLKACEELLKEGFRPIAGARDH